MPFNTALSGIRAASTDLRVTGNNIANVSTTAFKASRVEFGDVYATSVLGSGNNTAGSGVQIQDIKQRFTQGNVTFTENELDLAINGNGFFVVNQGGESLYTRSGAFGLDDGGFLTNNTGARLQGFSADAAGNIGGIQGDVSIQTSNLAPRQTTLVESILNLDSTEEVLQSTGQSFETEGNAIGVTQVGLQTATTTTLDSAAFTLPLANDFSATSMTMDITLSASGGNNGTVSIDLDTAAGVPATITTFNDLRTLASVINAQIFSPTLPQTPIDLVASAVDNGGGSYGLQFTALTEGENSQVTFANQSVNTPQIGLDGTQTSTGGIARVTNGYPSQSIDITNPSGTTITYTALAGATAASTASELNALQGVSATAATTLTLSNYANSAGNMIVNINGVDLAGDSLIALASEINTLTNSTLPGITAEVDPATGASMTIASAVGDDIRISITGTDDGDSITIQGDLDAPAQTLEIDSAGNGVAAGNVEASLNSIVVGGSISVVIDEGYAISNAVPPSIGLFQPISSSIFTEVTLNQFDPADQATYNSATSMTIYDSLGNAHILTQYFVKQDYDPADPTTSPNHWVMYVQIDGRDVGDPDTSLPPPQNTLPSEASYNIYFNEDGSLNSALTESILISNWTPLDENGDTNGSLGPQNVLAGGTVIIPEPPTSSNFVMDFTGTTQFGATFSVNDVDQNGYATGRLSGLSIDDGGIIFARFTNGESQTLGQIVLADFTNQQGLAPSGDSMWVENFESGPPNVGTPGSAALGVIQAGALEESNVDLSEQLVNLIIAQRNFQASAKTIETADQTTQTIINLR